MFAWGIVVIINISIVSIVVVIHSAMLIVLIAVPSYLPSLLSCRRIVVLFVTLSFVVASFLLVTVTGNWRSFYSSCHERDYYCCPSGLCDHYFYSGIDFGYM